jgi:hypothetical protein
MTTEVRTRITVILPFPRTIAQLRLVNQLLTQLTLLCGGVTRSTTVISPVFRGLWITPNQVVQRDAITLIFGDIPVSIKSQNLERYLSRLKLRAQHDFNQTIVWITIHEIVRISTGDGQK